MTTMNTQQRLTVVALATAALVAGCGGGDDSPSPAPTSQVPASASASIGGFLAYLQALVTSTADTLEPVDVGSVTPPADETSAPAVVD